MNKFLNILKEIVITVAMAVLIYLGVHFFISRAEINGESMEPTYQDGNHVMIFRRPFELENDDIVAFSYTSDEQEYYEETYSSNVEYPEKELHVKRIIGVAGDEVEIKNNTAYINGEKKSHSEVPLENQKYTLEEGEYFVQGDNLNNSYDSRYHGPIKEEDIYGKILTNK